MLLVTWLLTLSQIINGHRIANLNNCVQNGWNHPQKERTQHHQDESLHSNYSLSHVISFAACIYQVKTLSMTLMTYDRQSLCCISTIKLNLCSYSD